MDKTDLVIVYEVSTGFFESLIGLGLILFEVRVLDLYLKLRYSGFLGSHDFLIRLMERFIPSILSHHILVGSLLVLTGTVKITSGIGMVYKKVWAEYLLIGLLTLFLPLDVLGLTHHPSITKAAFLAVNILIILYLVLAKRSQS